MTVEVRPLGIRCNMQCLYCYQHSERDAANIPVRYNLEQIRSKVQEYGSYFTVFGGEPLLIPEKDLEHLWAWGLENYGRNCIQTNGTLINESHIRMFKQYRVLVGVSVDGPAELNDIRWCGTLEATRAATAKTHAAIERLCREEIPPSLIVTLHRNNATSDKLPVMRDWFKWLVGLGVRHARLHLLEVEHEDVGRKYSLSDDENVEALFSFADLERELPGLQLDIFGDVRNMLLGRDNCATCVWTGCDPYTTQSVQGIEGNGQSSNCGRESKDGVGFTKASRTGYERYLSLYHTPQEYGGCNGCRFFLMCKGNCPGTAMDGDWRNRSAFCGVWRRVFERFEEEHLDQGIVPLSISPKRQRVERIVLDHWISGQSCYLYQALEILEQQRAPNCQAATALRRGECNHGNRPHMDGHGDHWDAAPQRGHGDQPHGDRSHGDHSDSGGG